MKIKVNHVNEPTWIELTVSTKLPKNLLPLKEMAHNLWWVWNSRVKELYKSIDPGCGQLRVTIPLPYWKK